MFGWCIDRYAVRIAEKRFLLFIFYSVCVCVCVCVCPTKPLGCPEGALIHTHSRTHSCPSSNLPQSKCTFYIFISTFYILEIMKSEIMKS